jgi:thiosulfate dehydrogenase
VQIGDKKAGPLWGPDSWNDGAGAGRVYTLAGIVRYTMPYLNPGSLTDQEAQEVSAYINSRPRPKYPYKDRDYVGSKVPVDAVYYRSIE